MLKSVFIGVHPWLLRFCVVPGLSGTVFREPLLDRFQYNVGV
jgi:hypothetical protein